MTVRPREGTPAATLFPNDLPAEVVEDVVSELQPQIVHFQEVSDAVTSLGSRLEPLPDPAPIAHRDVRTAAERVADDRAAAQAASRAELWATMLDGEPPPPAPPRAVGPGWECHVHVNDTPLQLTSRAGLYYRMCSIRGCEEFEK